MTMKPLLSRLFPGLMEMRRERPVLGSNGRHPTIGSRRMRQLPRAGLRSLTFTPLRYEAIAGSEHDKRS
jgi:hypothetical protein